MYLVYPEGNWIEVDRRTPYLSIGETTYGKPILDRTLSFDSSMATALKVAYLSFDSTRFSSTDVGFPIDIVTYAAADRRWRESLYDYDDLRTQRDWWNQNITELAKTMPDGPWVDSLLPKGPSAHLAVVPDDPLTTSIAIRERDRSANWQHIGKLRLAPVRSRWTGNRGIPRIPPRFGNLIRGHV